MRILVLGAGGIGGYFGGRLVEVGADVTFLVRPRRYEDLVGGGLRIRSPFGNARLDVRVVRASEVAPRHDVVLLTCKAYDLESAMEAVVPGIAPDGMVLPLLNGIDHLASLDRRFGAERVLGGVARIGVTMAADGAIEHFSNNRHLIFGDRSGKANDRVDAILAEFGKAPGMVCEATDSIMERLWEKFVSLGTIASMACLLRANVGEIVATPDGTALLHAAFDKAAGAARFRGYSLSPEFLESTRALLADPASTANASLLRDLEAGRPLESEQITGALLREIRSAGLDATLFEAAYTHLKVAERRRSAAG